MKPRNGASLVRRVIQLVISLTASAPSLKLKLKDDTTKKSKTNTVTTNGKFNSFQKVVNGRFFKATQSLLITLTPKVLNVSRSTLRVFRLVDRASRQTLLFSLLF